MSIKTVLKTAAVIVLVVILLFYFSKGCARRSADTFLGRELTADMPYLWSNLSIYGIRAASPRASYPRWVVRYGGAFRDPGIEVEVSPFGTVLDCNLSELQQLIGLPIEARLQRIHALMIPAKTGQ